MDTEPALVLCRLINQQAVTIARASLEDSMGKSSDLLDCQHTGISQGNDMRTEVDAILSRGKMIPLAGQLAVRYNDASGTGFATHQALQGAEIDFMIVGA